jgi:alpha-tubulin suppressor-like RCC1 family protein
MRPDVPAVYEVTRTTVPPGSDEVAPVTSDIIETDGAAAFFDDLTIAPSALTTRDVDQLVARSNFACAIADGSLFCWGTGQWLFGDPTLSRSTRPVALSGFEGKTVTDLAIGYRHACAIVASEVFCWGTNDQAQLGDGTTTTSFAPVAVELPGPATDVAAGHTHSCAVIANAEVYCWGDGTVGQLGDGVFHRALTPVRADLPEGTVSAVSSDRYNTCAIVDAAAYCWGVNTNGEVGTGAIGDRYIGYFEPTPQAVVGIPAGATVTDVSTGGFHGCVVADGAVYCWGPNHAGELGIGVRSNPVPTAQAVHATGPLADEAVVQVSAGEKLTCALTVEQKLACWGDNSRMQFGQSGPSSEVPVLAATEGDMAGRTATAVGAAASFACALSEQRVYCWGAGGAHLGLGREPQFSNPPEAVVQHGALGLPVCAPGWLGVGMRCAPPLDWPVSYGIRYSKAGWLSPTAGFTATPSP